MITTADIAPFAGTVGGGFFLGFLTDFAIKKVLKLAAVIVGLFISPAYAWVIVKTGVLDIMMDFVPAMAGAIFSMDKGVTKQQTKYGDNNKINVNQQSDNQMEFTSGHKSSDGVSKLCDLVFEFRYQDQIGHFICIFG